MGKTQHQNLSWIPYITIVIVLHIIGFSFLWIAGREHHILFGMGILAYTLGLRHAFDADHIAAIDNTVRKLLQQRRDPVGGRFLFFNRTFYRCLFDGGITRYLSKMG